MDRPTDEDMTRDLGAYLEMAARFRQQSELNLAASRTHPSGTGYPEFLYESPLVAEAAARRATHAEAELVRLREEAASQRRKGRIDACRVLNEAASRFPAASSVLRECVRDIERMGR